ncbi:hypothetical protein V2W45_1342632 [Cenococcum geophilum]
MLSRPVLAIKSLWEFTECAGVWEIPRLHRYVTDIAHVDIYWFIGSRLHVALSYLPQPKSPIVSSSIVPRRYHFNADQQPPSY